MWVSADQGKEVARTRREAVRGRAQGGIMNLAGLLGNGIAVANIVERGGRRRWCRSAGGGSFVAPEAAASASARRRRPRSGTTYLVVATTGRKTRMPRVTPQSGRVRRSRTCMAVWAAELCSDSERWPAGGGRCSKRRDTWRAAPRQSRAAGCRACLSRDRMSRAQAGRVVLLYSGLLSFVRCAVCRAYLACARCLQLVPDAARFRLA